MEPKQGGVSGDGGAGVRWWCGGGGGEGVAGVGGDKGGRWGGVMRVSVIRVGGWEGKGGRVGGGGGGLERKRGGARGWEEWRWMQMRVKE